MFEIVHMVIQIDRDTHTVAASEGGRWYHSKDYETQLECDQKIREFYLNGKGHGTVFDHARYGYNAHPDTLLSISAGGEITVQIFACHPKGKVAKYSTFPELRKKARDKRGNPND